MYFVFGKQAYLEFTGFIKLLCDSVHGKRMTDDIPSTPVSEQYTWVHSTAALQIFDPKTRRKTGSLF